MFTSIRNTLILCVVVLALSGLTSTVVADTEANKAVYQRLNQEAWTQGQLAVVDEFIAPEYVYHEPAMGDIPGPEGLKQAITVYRTAYPDLNFTIDDMVAEGDLVALRWSAAGTHQGELMGIPATGLETATVGINIARFDGDGMIVEEWSSWDVAGLMQQLGVVQPPRPGPEFYVWDPPSEITGDPGDPVLNKLLVLRVKAQFWNGKDIAGLDETHHPNAIGHDPSFPGPPTYDAYKQSCLAYQVAFPDLHVTIDAIFAEGDKVVSRWTAKGTHLNELTGIPASGKAVEFKGITIYRMADGKVAETWWAYDAFGVVQQITSPPEYSPVGVWILSIPTPMGNILMLHNNHAQDLAGTQYGGTILHVNNNPTNFGMFPDVEDGTGWVTQTSRTGPNTFVTTMIGYGTKNRENAPQELATIDIATANWQLTSPDTKEGVATMSTYLASQDADGDGFPDEGQEPVSCMPFAFTGRRLGVVPGCVPPELPDLPGQ